jgi:ABC-2 type transport system permease protein
MVMNAWWRGTQLVAGRALGQNLRSRSFKVVTGLLLLLSIAVIVVPRLLTNQVPTYTLATIGTADPALVGQLDAAARSGQFTVQYTVRTDSAGVQAAVRDGTATAGLADGTLYVEKYGTGTFPVLIAQAVVAQETVTQLAAAGLTPAQVTDLQNIRPPQQVPIGQVQNEGRAATGFVVGIVPTSRSPSPAASSRPPSPPRRPPGSPKFCWPCSGPARSSPATSSRSAR